MHHFFLKFDNLSVKIEYNAVGVDYTARQIGLITRPALTGRAFIFGGYHETFSRYGIAICFG
jgi:hypothetical protein